MKLNSILSESTRTVRGTRLSERKVSFMDAVENIQSLGSEIEQAMHELQDSMHNIDAGTGDPKDTAHLKHDAETLHRMMAGLVHSFAAIDHLANKLGGDF